MEFLRAEDSANAAESWLKDRVAKYRASSLFLPAGETPKPLYARWRAHPPAYLAGLRLLQVDDVLDGPGQGVFARFFAEELPAYRVEPPHTAQAGDLAILGFGTNGHIAFHEPHLPADFAHGEVSLAPDTCARLQLPAGTKGISYGVGAFLRCRAVLLVVKGKGKREAWEQFLRADSTLPSARLKAHPDFRIWTDL